VSAPDRRRRTARDERRRRLGQNFLLPDVAASFVARGSFTPGELVVEIGAGRGACTHALAGCGVDVVAIEPDPRWAALLRRDMRHRPNVRVVEADALTQRLDVLAEGRPYRVLGSLPFGVTTALLRHLFDDPDPGRAPWRADLVVQWEVARKRAAAPPTTLLSTTWAPWWSFEVVRRIPAQSFRPVPAVDAAVLRVVRRSPAILPEGMAAGFAEFVRQAWR
jgi:23S rRNA (adenine-N6)-dimethyltransferase